MSSETRVKMVAGAADLMSRRGVNGTSMRDVVRHTGTPRGSIGHHFPRGKQELIEDAILFAGRKVSGPLEHLTRDRGAIAGLREFIALWRKTLEKSKFQAGCPVLAVATEQFVIDATERDVSLMFDLNKDFGTTLIIVTHNQEMASRTGRIIKLKSGHIVSDEKNEPSLTKI